MVDSVAKSSPSAAHRRADERDMILKRMLQTKPKPHAKADGGAKSSPKSLKNRKK